MISGAKKVGVVLDDKEYTARIVRSDIHNDLTLLKIEGSFPALSFASRNSVKMGSDVFTIGFPNTVLQGVNKKLTDGVIGSLAGFQDDIRLYQISAPVQLGNSGGALINENGNVVGIIVSILKAEAAFKTSGALPQNVNYALKSTYALAMIDTVPKASQALLQPSKKETFGKITERISKSVVMILTYK